MRTLYIHGSSDHYGSAKILLDILQIDNNAKEALAILPHEGVLTKDLTKLGVQYKIINLGVLRRKYFTPWGIIGRLFLWAKAIIQLRKLIRKNNIEQVYINSANVIIGPFLRSSGKVKLIWHLHEIVESPTILKSFLAYFISKADTVIAVSKATQSFWNSSHKNINAQLLYNGIDTAKYTNRQWPTGPITIGMIGRVQKWKGQDYLLEIIEAFNDLSARKNESAKNETNNSLSKPAVDATMLPQLKVIIAGDAYPGYEYLEDELKESIREKGLEQQVEYLGYNDNIPELFNQLHLLILPSTSPDPLPTVVLEAMAASKPVVATKQGGALEMIQENETGVFIPINNAKEAALILEKTIREEAILKSMGEAGLKRVQEHFSKTAFANNWKSILK